MNEEIQGKAQSNSNFQEAIYLDCGSTGDNWSLTTGSFHLIIIRGYLWPKGWVQYVMHGFSHIGHEPGKLYGTKDMLSCQ